MSDEEIDDSELPEGFGRILESPALDRALQIEAAEREALKRLLEWREAEQLVECFESERMFGGAANYDSDKALRDARDDLEHKTTRLRAAADSLAARAPEGDDGSR